MAEAGSQGGGDPQKFVHYIVDMSGTQYRHGILLERIARAEWVGWTATSNLVSMI